MNTTLQLMIILNKKVAETKTYNKVFVSAIFDFFLS